MRGIVWASSAANVKLGSEVASRGRMLGGGGGQSE
jgi:hypothetical protein